VDPIPLLSSEAREIKGYNIKLLAILFSSFAEAIFIDADAVFLVNPELMFASSQYLNTGMLMFPDWPVNPMPAEFGKVFEAWMLEFMPDLDLSHASEIEVDFVRGRTRFLIEAGVVVMNKRTRFVQLLAQTCLVLPRFFDLFENRFLGDKELFWFAAHMAGEPFGLAPGPAGRVGHPHPDFPYTSHMCSDHIAHFFPSSPDPMWFNQGVYINKHEQPRRIDNITHFSRYAPGLYLNYAHNNAGCAVMFRDADMTKPVAIPLPRHAISVVDFYVAQVHSIERIAATIGVEVHLPARSHGIPNTGSADKTDSWQNISARCKRELRAMRIVKSRLDLSW